MPPASQAVLIIDPLPADIEAEMAARFELLRAYRDGFEALVEAHGASIVGMTSRGKSTISEAMIARLPNLQIISAYGVGYDRIDAAAAASRGITVTNTPDVLNADVADLAVALLLATIRRIPQADRFVREGAWMAGTFPLTATLRNRTVGMVGMGRIGQEIARRLAAFDVAIVYHSRNMAPGMPYRHYPDLVAMAQDVDTMILIVPGGRATDNLINEAVLEALGKNGVLINVARGNVVDQPALIRALQGGTILAAGLDVYDGEPTVPAELIALDNVVLLPHVGSGTVDTRAAMGRLFLDNLIGWFETGAPVTPVAECRSLTPNALRDPAGPQPA